MAYCTQCGASLYGTGGYCSTCGGRTPAFEPDNTAPRPQAPYMPPQTRGPAVMRGFGQALGLDPRVAFLTLIVDLMLNAGEIASMGLLLPVSVGAAVVLGYVTYRAQLNWYGDDKESAKLKAIILTLLTAIPTALPAIVYVPSGVLGLVHNARRKLPHT